jgi:hypothetical protein
MHGRGSSPDPGWCVDVLRGANAGARIPLGPGAYRLGGDPGDDIVLADGAIAAAQACLEVGAAGITLTSLVAGTSLRRRRLSPGRTVMLRPGAELRMGATVLRVSGPAAPRRQRTALLASVVAAVALLGGGAAFRFGDPVVAPGPATAPVQPAAQADAASVGAAFAEHLRPTALGGAVHLAPSGSAVIATGALLAADRAGWLAAQRWFDARFGGRYALVDRTEAREATEPPPLDIAAVSMRPVPNVVTRTGEHYTAGAVLAGGWSIVAIAPDAVTLRREGHDVRITL